MQSRSRSSDAKVAMRNIRSSVKLLLGGWTPFSEERRGRFASTRWLLPSDDAPGVWTAAPIASCREGVVGSLRLFDLPVLRGLACELLSMAKIASGGFECGTDFGGQLINWFVKGEFSAAGVGAKDIVVAPALGYPSAAFFDGLLQAKISFSKSPKFLANDEINFQVIGRWQLTTT